MNSIWESDELASRIKRFVHEASASDQDSRGKDHALDSSDPANRGDENRQASNDNGNGETTQGKVSKKAMKKAAKAKLKPKKEKKPNMWNAPNPGKKKKKTEAIQDVKYENTTPKGHKKDLSGEMPAAYQPGYVEMAWQDWWEAKGFYTPDVTKALGTSQDDKFVMVIPPPNVTGSLHLGHALTDAIEDTLTRWHRMSGRIALWVPGIDHAGIATQTVVEKMLKKEQNISRHDLGREKFLERVWEWKTTYGGKILDQIRKMGASVDWTREAFTMDENLTVAVVEAFCRFYEDGLLYRDTRLVNWSCALKSAISEIEVDYIDLEGRTMLAVPGCTSSIDLIITEKNIKGHTSRDKYEFGMLTSFAYPVEHSEEVIIVATTRLETMLGDTAVAVHPDDPRYKHLHGKHVVHPFNSRRLPIVLDPVLVDMEFGTGAVKITPAHDPNDYECGKRHNLEMTVIFASDGTINENGAPFQGMMRYDARIAIEKDLDKKGLLKGKVPNKMRLGLCSRSGDVIEPFLTPQWYVNCDSMAAKAVEVVQKGELKILPDFHKITWYRWLENPRDWCISRQLWWGHRIPAYFTYKKAEIISDDEKSKNDRWIIARSLEEAQEKAVEKYGVPIDEIVLEQDEDVLDTWFSSGLFPFSVFGWPKETDDFKAFYPTTLLETGMDILFFWVARMVMMGLHLTGKLPFTTVYLHAMVRDDEGRKMSKSLGNVVDPLEVIEGCALQTLIDKLWNGNLPQKEIERAEKNHRKNFPDGIPPCGADALRFGLLSYTQQGRDINLNLKRLVTDRNFCNKLWNAVRFALTYVTDLSPTWGLDRSLTSMDLSRRDRFILSRLNYCIRECLASFQSYQFGQLTIILRSFWLNDLCDLYLESIKPVMNDCGTANQSKRMASQAVLYTCLEYGLRLMHPLMPYVTEELWQEQRLPGRGSLGPLEPESIMISPYPEVMPEWEDSETETRMNLISDVVRSARSLKAQYDLPPQSRPSYYVSCSSDVLAAKISEQRDDIECLAKAQEVFVIDSTESIPKGCALMVVNDQCQVHMSLKGMIDFTKEIQKLEKELEKLQLSIDGIQEKISATGYNDKVPEKVRKSMQEKLDQYLGQRESIIGAIKSFKSYI